MKPLDGHERNGPVWRALAAVVFQPPVRMGMYGSDQFTPTEAWSFAHATGQAIQERVAIVVTSWWTR